MLHFVFSADKPHISSDKSNDSEDRSYGEFVKSFQPLLLSETHDGQQHKSQDGEGESPYEDGGERVQGPTWKSQQAKNSQLQHALTMYQWTQLDVNVTVRPESSPEYMFSQVEFADIVSSAQRGWFWSKNITSVCRVIL